MLSLGTKLVTKTFNVCSTSFVPTVSVFKSKTLTVNTHILHRLLSKASVLESDIPGVFGGVERFRNSLNRLPSFADFTWDVAFELQGFFQRLNDGRLVPRPLPVSDRVASAERPANELSSQKFNHLATIWWPSD